MITNEQLTQLHTLYWFKDYFKEKEITIEYLKHLKTLANELEVEGLVKEIENYLLILENGK